MSSRSELDDLLRKIIDIINNWGKWDENEDYYLNEVAPQLLENPSMASKSRNELKYVFSKLQTIIPRDEWHSLPQLLQKALNEKRNALDEKRTEDKLNEERREQERKTNEEKRREKLRLEEEKKMLLAGVEAMLREFSFPEADHVYINKSDLIGKREYENLKSKYVMSFFGKLDPKFSTDYEKAVAVSKVAQNVLIKARAGSGKTTTLAWKVALLVEKYDVPVDNIMVLAFNREAAIGIKTRIRDKLGNTLPKLADFETARTFHSLAWQIVNPEKEDVVFDEPKFQKERTNLISECFKTLEGVVGMKRQLYTFFRREMEELDLAESLPNLQLEYDERRKRRRNHKLTNQLQFTLDGKKVKSIGEKYIADFLFEHNIRYVYEKYNVWYKNSYKRDKSHWGYRPDFTIYGERVPTDEIVLEHWGIKENDPEKRISPYATCTYDEYAQQIVEKRNYWKDREITLLETSVEDMKHGREQFEKRLKSRLEGIGIICEKLPDKELYQRMRKAQIYKFTSLLGQFIQKAKQKGWSPKGVAEEIDKYSCSNKKETLFLNIAIGIYQNYEERCLANGKFDFDSLLSQATEKIHETQGSCLVQIKGERQLALRDLQWLLIDEYQDFSRLFFDLVKAIQTYNPALNILAVGDDWQAINGFAGSDLDYFRNFESHFSCNDEALLQNNYRSRSKIVEQGNLLMKGEGSPSKPLETKQGGRVTLNYIENYWINESKREDKLFTFGKDSSFSQARYLKACFEVIKDFVLRMPHMIDKYNADGNSAPFAIIMARVNFTEPEKSDDRKKRLDKPALSFKDMLIRALMESEELRHCNFSQNFLENQIVTDTAHSQKGLEAPLVIILRATEENFPLIHPNTPLLSLFEDSSEENKTQAAYRNALEEEKRLFYVALTRAEEELCILTEKGNESRFLQELRFDP